MFRMMYGMGPRGGRRMRRGGYRTMSMFPFPGILLGGLFGLYGVLALLTLLSVAGVVTGSVFAALGSMISGAVAGIRRAALSDSVAIGTIIGLLLFSSLRRQKNAQAGTKEE